MTLIKQLKAHETYSLRKEVLRKNIDLPYIFDGDEDPETRHFGLFSNNKLVSVVSFMRRSLPDFTGDQFQLRGMATSEDHQHKGFGRILLAGAEKELLKKHPGLLIWCNARVAAVDFYKKSGYRILGDEFYIDKIGGHFKMYKKLKK